MKIDLWLQINSYCERAARCAASGKHMGSHSAKSEGQLAETRADGHLRARPAPTRAIGGQRTARPGGKIDGRLDRWYPPLAINLATSQPRFFVFDRNILRPEILQ